MPSYRVIGVPQPFIALFSIAWVHFIEGQAFLTSTFVMILIYSLLMVVLIMVFNGSIRDFFFTHKTQAPQQEELLQKEYKGFEERWAFSRRESEVFEHLVAGKKYRDIELACGLSRGTVKTHISNIYRKLNVHSKGEMLVLFRENNGRVDDESEEMCHSVPQEQNLRPKHPTIPPPKNPTKR